MVNTPYLAKNKPRGAQMVDMGLVVSLYTRKVCVCGGGMIRKVEIFSLHLMGIHCPVQLLWKDTYIRKTC